MEIHTLTPPPGSAFNFDVLYVGGVNITDLIRQMNGQNSMAYSADTAVITERYVAVSAGSGYSPGNILRRSEFVNVTVQPPTSVVVWFNFTTNQTLVISPSISDLQLDTQSGLTDTELRQAPVVIVTDPTSPDVIAFGDQTDLMAPETGSGDYSAMSAFKRMVNLLYRMVSIHEWESVGFTLDAKGRLLSETETNGTLTRYRTWTHSEGTDGAVTSISGQWNVS